MKVAILGCGVQGSTIARYMVEKKDVAEVKLADKVLERAHQLASELEDEKVYTYCVDANKTDDLLELVKGVDVVVNAVIPRFNLRIMKASLKVGANYVDMASGPPYVNEEQLAQDSYWKKARLTAIMNTGFSPGVTNVLAAKAADQLDKVDEVHIRAAEKILPGTRRYEGREVMMESWSPETEWTDMAEPPVIFEDGKWKTMPLFSGEETYRFPDPLGSCNIVYHAHEEVYTIPRFIKGVEKVDVKFGWEPTTMIAKAVIELGLLSDKPLTVGGVEVVPRNVFLKLLKLPLTTEELIRKIEGDTPLETAYLFVTEVKGEKAGARITYKFYYPPKPMSLREAYKKYGRRCIESPGLTGLSCAILAHMLGAEEIKVKGVVPPEGLTRGVRETFLAELMKRGYAFKEVLEEF